MQLKQKDFIFVGIQFFLFFCFFFNFGITLHLPNWFKSVNFYVTIFGILILLLALLQLNKNLSPFPTPKDSAILIQNGLYKFVRHPIYSGIIISFIGFSCYSDSLYRLIISILIYILFFFKTKYEEQQLYLKFSAYDIYKQKTGRFFPILFKTI